MPFSLAGGTAVGTGRGEELAPVLTSGELRWVVAVSTHNCPPRQCSAASATGCEGSAAAFPDPEVSAEALKAVRTSDAERLAPLLHNDLQEAAPRCNQNCAGC